MQKELYLKKVCFQTKFLTKCRPFIFVVTVYSKDYTSSIIVTKKPGLRLSIGFPRCYRYVDQQVFGKKNET